MPALPPSPQAAEPKLDLLDRNTSPSPAQTHCRLPVGPPGKGALGGGWRFWLWLFLGGVGGVGNKIIQEFYGIKTMRNIEALNAAFCPSHLLPQFPWAGAQCPGLPGDVA